MPDGKPVTATIALGSNLGDSVSAVQRAIAAIAALPGTRLCACSSLYRSAPWQAEGPDFVNAVVEVSTRLGPLPLLDALQAIEAAAGRERPYPHAPRSLDLDLLRHGDTRMDSPRLTLPHPRMAERAFVLLPLAEIAPDQVPAAWLHAVAGQAIERLSVPARLAPPQTPSPG